MSQITFVLLFPFGGLWWFLNFNFTFTALIDVLQLLAAAIQSKLKEKWIKDFTYIMTETYLMLLDVQAGNCLLVVSSQVYGGDGKDVFIEVKSHCDFSNEIHPII